MFFGNAKSNYSKLTEYNREMTTKKNNYTFLNEKYALENQTVLLGDSITDFLNWYGAYGLKCDKNFGPLTEDAVEAFQKAEGLVADGDFGSKSLAKAKTIKK